MSTILDNQSAHGPGPLKKAATIAIAAGSLGLAVFGLGIGATGTANAGGPSLTCPQFAVGEGGVATVANFTVVDGSGITVRDVASDAVVGSSGGNGSVHLIWPQPWAVGPHTLIAAVQRFPDPLPPKGSGFPVSSPAYCTVSVAPSGPSGPSGNDPLHPGQTVIRDQAPDAPVR